MNSYEEDVCSHNSRMWKDIYLPFLVGMASLAWTVGAVYCDLPAWLALLSLPGILWCQYKLYPFLWDNDVYASEEAGENEPDCCPKCRAAVIQLWSGVKCSKCSKCSWWFCH